MFITGYKFLCWSIVFAPAGENRGRSAVFNLCCLLCVSCDFCEEQCFGNKRKITPRNWNCTSSIRVEVLLSFFIPRIMACCFSCYFLSYIIDPISEMIRYLVENKNFWGGFWNMEPLFLLILTLSIQICSLFWVADR